MNEWKPKSLHFQQALKTMMLRKKGVLKSFRTPWESLNRATLNGLEFNTITVIGGRPSSGKTLMIDQLIREGFPLNPELSIRVLQFQFEMVGEKSAMREFSAVTKQTYRYLNSADGAGASITKEVYDLCIKHAEEVSKYPVDVVDDPKTVLELEAIIHKYMKTYAVIKLTKDGKQIRQYPHTIISLDHSMLIRKDKHESNKNETLFNLGEVLTKLKKMYPIAFIILTQLNRSIEEPGRNEDGKYGNYIIPSDIYGADALNQHADFIFALTRPGLRFIKYYGPDRFIIDHDDIIACHYLKNRNGVTGIGFFEAAFYEMSIKEINTPPQDLTVKTKK
jgi:replicative DNA helicase